MVRTSVRTYELRLQEFLGPGVTGLFPEFSVRHGEDGITVLTGTLPDQAALHGALARVRDLGLVLESLRCVVVDDASGPQAGAEAAGGDPR